MNWWHTLRARLWQMQHWHRWRQQRAEQTRRETFITASGGDYLLLGPAGSGKTRLLEKRIAYAAAHGVNTREMLFLTMTTRAAQRVAIHLAAEIKTFFFAGPYVGTLHLFCKEFLERYGLLDERTQLIDEDEAQSIITPDEEEEEHEEDTAPRRRGRGVVDLAALLFQIEHDHPRELLLYRRALTASDIAALTASRRGTGPRLTRTTFLALVDTLRTENEEEETTPERKFLRWKIHAADRYTAYKRKYHLVDFADLLLLTYEALRHEGEENSKGERTAYKHYPWAAVDDVQDLTPLQMAIITMLTTPSGAEKTPVALHGRTYAGDSKQAIFVFKGATATSLTTISEQCKGHILRLTSTYRQEQRLVDFINSYVAAQMKEESTTPAIATRWTTVRKSVAQRQKRETRLDDYIAVAEQAQHWAKQHPKEKTALVVRTNDEADDLSEVLRNMGIAHLNISGNNDDDEEMQAERWGTNNFNIVISTIHKTIGQEYDNVIVVDYKNYHFHDDNLSRLEAREEEKRLLYVAMTRATKRLLLPPNAAN